MLASQPQNKESAKPHVPIWAQPAIETAVKKNALAAPLQPATETAVKIVTAGPSQPATETAVKKIVIAAPLLPATEAADNKCITEAAYQKT